VTRSLIDNVAQTQGSGDLAISVKIEKGGTLTITESTIRGPSPSTVTGTAGPIIDANNTDNSFGGGNDPGPIELTVSGSLLERNLAGQAIVNTNSSAGLTTFTADLSGNAWVDGTVPAVLQAGADVAGVTTAGGALATDTDYTPWLLADTDTDGATPGFQGDFGELGLDSGSPQAGAGGPRIVEADGLSVAPSILRAYATGGSYDVTTPYTLKGSFVVEGALAFTGASSTAPSLSIPDDFGVGASGSVETSGTLDGPIFELLNVTEGTAGLGNDAGWRFFAAPVAGAQVQDLKPDIDFTGPPAAPTDVGILGPDDAAMIWFWDSATQDWVRSSTNPAAATGSLTDPLPSGEGYILYFFDDSFQRVEPGSPTTLDFQGRLLDDTGTFPPFGDGGFGLGDVSVTFDAVPTASPDIDGNSSVFDFLGVPYGQSFDLSSLTEGTSPGTPIGGSGSNYQAPVQVWNPTLAGSDGNGNTGQYVTVTAGGQLAPYQAFFVERSNVPDPSTRTLTFQSGGRFVGAPFIPAKNAATTSGFLDVAVSFETGGQVMAFDESRLYVRDGTQLGWDAYDASKLYNPQPRGPYLVAPLVGTRGGSSAYQEMVSLPPSAVTSFVSVGLDLLPIALGAGTMTVEITRQENVPASWNVILADNETGARVDLEAGPYTFAYTPPADAKAAPAVRPTRATLGKPGAAALAQALAAQGKSAFDADNPRFTLDVGPEAAIPVELGTFTGRRDGQDAVLTWTTLTETNNAGFHVEQRAPGQAAFRDAAFVEGAGTTAEPQTYTHRLAALAPGTHTFRLRQVDFDGASERTETVEVEIGLDAPYRVLAPYPNPTRGRTTLEVAVREAQHVTVTVYDVLGRRVATAFDGELPSNDPRRLTLATRGLASGAYFVRVEGAAFRTTRRLTVVR
jgi:hypothetical protein